MRPPRRLSPDEAAIWRKVADTVTPLERRRARRVEVVEPTPAPVPAPVVQQASVKIASPQHPAAARRGPPPRSGEDKVGLDAAWEKKITRGGLEPDFSLDLHGSGLDQAYGRLMHGLAQARAMGARVVLVVTGKPRPTEAADRGQARGAIRAKIVDWLGASEHASAIAAIRGAHRRHGGPGALYVVLKRKR
ncbi:DNA-nicking Smr family endonuclease [Novosphingobium chloroacetimidivorans]|uniref:DNA-nicking Smr family endonuclease n=1 Tax=Novosphingobium chloroacetimidivorans TaxID=1428314 RepID=A0A7W7NWK0_9SPHN|nr:Smr/MutS family protein [Novosphingobium chloroacetimidivorans]MBB4859416.1 DNA-nicking Smr family endonuclease [Novosphingobium chloroacetimidivorans]